MALRDSAPDFIKSWVWDRKFRQSGVAQSWIAPPHFVSIVYTCSGPAGAVLDFGCGTGTMFAELVRLGWHGDYVGVDISPAAIELACQHGGPNAQWTVSPIEDYAFSRSFDAICFLESIYYVRPSSLGDIMAKCVHHLTEQGRIFVRVCDRSRHAETIRQLESLRCDRLSLFVKD